MRTPCTTNSSFLAQEVARFSGGCRRSRTNTSSAFRTTGNGSSNDGLRLDQVKIYHFDGRNFARAKRVRLPTMPSHVIFPANSKIVFVTLQVAGDVAAIDLSSPTALWKMPIGTAPAGLWLTLGGNLPGGGHDRC